MKSKHLSQLGAVWFLAILSHPGLPAMAGEIHGIEFPEEAVVESCPLVLNGVATRTFWGIKVYVVGLFLCEPCQDEEQIMATDRLPKRIRIVMLRNVSKEKFVSTFQENLEKNLNSEERGKYEAEIAALFECFDGSSDLGKGTAVTIDFHPGMGTVVTAGENRFEAIPGDDFYHIMLRLWIGRPLQESIKERPPGPGAIKGRALRVWARTGRFRRTFEFDGFGITVRFHVLYAQGNFVSLRHVRPLVFDGWLCQLFQGQREKPDR